jgi:RimJ/RimL family protein N-acetyltransferase
MLREADAACEMERLVDFLCRHEWPFHGTCRLSAEQVRAMSFSPPTTRTFWIEVAGDQVGLVRVQDLDDIGSGSPILDVRLASEMRGRGIGRGAVERACALVFGEYPDAHRIEAATRVDNTAMRTVLTRCGFELEGRLRQAWPTERGAWTDAVVYGLLRSDWDLRAWAEPVGGGN